MHSAKISSWIRFKRVPNTNDIAENNDDDDEDIMEVDNQPGLTSPEFEFVGNKSNNTIEENDRKIVSDLRKWLDTNPQVESLIEAGLSTQASFQFEIATTNPFGGSIGAASPPGGATNRLGNSNAVISSPPKVRVSCLGDISREGYFDVVCQVLKLEIKIYIISS